MATKKKDAIPDEEMLLEQQAIAEEQPLSQTGSDVASEEVSRAEESPPAPDESPAPQTDSENTDSERIPAEDALDPPASIADSQTETEAAEKPAEGPRRLGGPEKPAAKNPSLTQSLKKRPNMHPTASKAKQNPAADGPLPDRRRRLWRLTTGWASKPRRIRPATICSTWWSP